jgi:hypothetical protein
MLQKIGFQPGINKQISDTTAEGQWVDCDNVRFRYGTPEKIGGWKQLGDDKLTGAGRGLHHFVNSLARKYAIIGTNRILYAYSGVYFMISILLNLQQRLQVHSPRPTDHQLLQ